MWEFLKSLAARAVPAVAGTITAYGVTEENSVVIATGAVVGVVSVIELIMRRWNKTNG